MPFAIVMRGLPDLMKRFRPPRKSLSLRARDRPRSGSRGFSILTVLLSLTLLATILAAFAGVVQNRTSRIAREVQAAHGAHAAEAGVALAVAMLLDDAARADGAPSSIAADGTPFDCRLPNGTLLTIGIQDIAGRIDLNSASENLLRGALAGLAEPEQVDALVASIVSRRGGDGFRLKQEFATLRGVTRELYTVLEPDLTVHSRTTTLNRQTTRPVLRQRLTRAGVPDVVAYAASADARVFALQISARTAPNRGYKVDTIVELRPERHPAFNALTWSGHVVAASDDGTAATSSTAEATACIASEF